MIKNPTSTQPRMTRPQTYQEPWPFLHESPGQRATPTPAPNERHLHNRSNRNQNDAGKIPYYPLHQIPAPPTHHRNPMSSPTTKSPLKSPSSKNPPPNQPHTSQHPTCVNNNNIRPAAKSQLPPRKPTKRPHITPINPRIKPDANPQTRTNKTQKTTLHVTKCARIV